MGDDSTQVVYDCLIPFLDELEMVGVHWKKEPEVIVRKRVSQPSNRHQVVEFHRDTHLAVVNIALNDEFEGGKLMFALDDGSFTCPPRSKGSVHMSRCFKFAQGCKVQSLCPVYAGGPKTTVRLELSGFGMTQHAQKMAWSAKMSLTNGL